MARAAAITTKIIVGVHQTPVLAVVSAREKTAGLPAGWVRMLTSANGYLIPLTFSPQSSLWTRSSWNIRERWIEGLCWKSHSGQRSEIESKRCSHRGPNAKSRQGVNLPYELCLYSESHSLRYASLASGYEGRSPRVGSRLGSSYQAPKLSIDVL